MKKRILAFLTAVLMIFSAFIMSACDKTPGGDESSETSIDVSKLSAKELFAYSFSNTVLGGVTEMPDILTMSSISDFKGKMNLAINKLEVSGEDIFGGKAVELGADVAIDGDNRYAEVGFAFEMLGEKMPASVILADETAYITDLLGVNDKTIMATFDDLGISLAPDSMNNSAQTGMNMIGAELAGIMTYAGDALSAAIEANIPDDAFVKETKDCTVDGKEYKGATVITLEITNEMAKNLVKDIAEKLLENETIQSMLEGEFNVEDVTEQFGEIFGGIKIVNTIDVSKTVGFNIDIGIYETETLHHLTVDCAFVDDNFRVTIGSPEFTDKVEVTYTVSDGKEEFKFGGIIDGEEVVLMSANGTVSGGKHSGTATIGEVFSGANTITIGYMFSGDLLNGSFGIDGISVTESGATTNIPIKMEISYKIEDKKISADMSIKFEMSGMMDIDMDFGYAIEATSVTVKVPANATSINELSEDEVMEWMTEFYEKYPKIIEFIESMSGYEGEVQPDYDY